MLSLALALTLAQPFVVATPSPLVVWPAIKGQFIQYCGVGRPCTVSDIKTNDGTALLPAYSFVNDVDTGFYRPGSNQIGVAIGGGRSFVFDSTATRLYGDTAAPSLTLNATSGSTIAYNTTSVNVGSSNITLQSSGGFVFVNGAISRNSGTTIAFEDNDGLQFVGVAAASLPSASGNNLYTDTNTNRLWFREGTPSATQPWYPLSAGEHPVIQRRPYFIDVGSESTSTPTFAPSPRRGGATVSMTMVDAAAATGIVIGTAPYVTDVRGSVTATTINSISSAIASTPWIRLDHGPRWCQKVSFDTKSTIRIWLGMSAALPGSTDTSASQNVSFRFSTVSDANWQACSRDGTTQSCTDTGVSANNGTTAFQLLCIDCFENGACLYSVDGAVRVRKTTNLPVNTTLLSNYWSVEALAAAAARTLYAGTSSVDIR